MAAKLKPSTFEGTVEIPAQVITREVKGLLVILTGNGEMLLREKGRRLGVGPFSIKQLYQDGLQRQAGNAPLKPRKLRKGSSKVNRGLLGTGDGK